MFRQSRFNRPIYPRALLGWCALLALGLALLLAAGRPAGAGLGQPPTQPPGTAQRPAHQTIPPAAGIERHRVVATIPLAPGIGQDPMAIAADPHGPLVYVANRGSSDITVLSGTQVLGRVAAVHEGLHDGVGMLLAAHPATGQLYALETTGARCFGPVQTFHLQVISATQAITSVSLGGCPLERRGCSADDMAFQPATGYLYLLRTYTVYTFPPHGSITVLDGAAVLDEISLDNYSPNDVAADPARGWVYVSSVYADNVLVFSGTAVVGTVPVTDAAAIAVQPRTGLAYVVSHEAHLAVVSGTAVLDRFPVGGIVADLAADPARGYLYVSYRYMPTLTVVSGTAVLTDVVVPASGGQIEVNAATGLVYLRYPGTAQMTVLSGTAVLTTVEVLSGSAPLASSPFSGLVYAVDGNDSVAVFSGTQRLGAIPPAAPRPRALAAHPASGQVAVLSDPPALSWIEGESIVATVPLTAAPNQALIHPTSGLLYLALPAERSVLVLSGTTTLAAVSLAGPPVQMAVRPGGGSVHVVDDAGVLTIISGTEALAALPLSVYGLAGVAVHPGSGLAYVTDPWAGRVHVVSGTTVLTDVVVGSYPQAVAVEPGSGIVYVEVGGDSLWLISGTQVVTTVNLPGSWTVEGLYAAPAGGTLYVHERQSLPYQCDQVEVYRGTAPVAAWTLPEGARYSAFALHPSLSYAYAGHAVYGSLLSVGAGARLVETLPVGEGSWVRAVAVVPGTGRVYAATDHAIAILEMDAAYRFFMPLLIKELAPGAAGQQPVP
jgi:DNA-binding beta-propeller fold protein YncE